VLVYGTLDIPPFGNPDNPAHHHVAPRYVEESEHEIGVPNIVTSVLASYRGYDTMGETTVIFTAAVAVLLLIATGPKPVRQAQPGPPSPGGQSPAATAVGGAPSGAVSGEGTGAGSPASGKRSGGGSGKGSGDRPGKGRRGKRRG
jgi:hypothetical protein